MNHSYNCRPNTRYTPHPSVCSIAFFFLCCSPHFFASYINVMVGVCFCFDIYSLLCVFSSTLNATNHNAYNECTLSKHVLWKKTFCSIKYISICNLLKYKDVCRKLAYRTYSFCRICRNYVRYSNNSFITVEKSRCSVEEYSEYLTVGITHGCRSQN